MLIEIYEHDGRMLSDACPSLAGMLNLLDPEHEVLANDHSTQVVTLEYLERRDLQDRMSYGR
jgi:hypothetical protein